MEGKLFRVARIAHLFEASRQFVQGLVPGDPLPLSLTALAHALHGIKDPVRVIELIDPSLPLGAYLPPSPDGIRVPFQLDQSSILYETNHGISGHAAPTG